MVSLLIIMAICSYFVGNVNWALIISKLKKKDIREMGSGNPGTLNMSRNFGLGIGLLTFFLDVFKGAICSLVAYFVFKDKILFNFPIVEFAIYLCGFCVVLGHIYPIFLKFKGGKGIASTIGVFLVCESVNGWYGAVVSVMALVAAGVFIYFTEFGAMGSFIAITPPAICGCIRLFYNEVASLNITLHILTNMLIFLICFFTWFAHRKNIKRMLAGEEHPTSIKQMVVKLKAKKLKEKGQIVSSSEDVSDVQKIIKED